MSAACKPGVARDRCFVPERLERIFAACFLESCCTRLAGGAREPLYQPAEKAGGLHLLWYRDDYFASALHEAAHWCIAGERRRQMPDFGYWYAPDGRDSAQQAAFEAVEAKPQALEWLFSLACGYRFRISVDNLSLTRDCEPDNEPFRRAVLARARAWQRDGLPARAAILFRALAREFDTGLQCEALKLELAGLCE